MATEVTVNITEVTLVSGKRKNVKVNIDGVDVYIPVDAEVHTYFHEQFARQNPTYLQKEIYDHHESVTSCIFERSSGREQLTTLKY